MWGKFQMSKECDDKRQERMKGMMYWSKTNGIDIDIAVFLVNLEIKEMVKKNQPRRTCCNVRERRK